ncbi:MAG: hypothetical protein U0L17_02160 [Acutalibacteraceae bacterium]|nr:hypothetical protein [Acutalibacteraceae bacterium]
MADIKLEYNNHRLALLKKILSEQDKTLDAELSSALDTLYEKYVPEKLKAEIESLIARENAELRQTENCFAVYHLHDDFDDYHFTDEFNNSFYDAACRYCEMLEYGYKSKTVDTVAHEYFPDNQQINVSVFSVLCNTMPNDNRISALIEFDLEDETVSVCDSSDNAWRAYHLEDVADAVHKVKLKSYLILETDREIFNNALAGKEIDFESEDETDDFIMQM